MSLPGLILHYSIEVWILGCLCGAVLIRVIYLSKGKRTIPVRALYTLFMITFYFGSGTTIAKILTEYDIYGLKGFLITCGLIFPLIIIVGICYKRFTISIDDTQQPHEPNGEKVK